ncbi:hypothetical protein GJ629_08865 [Halapricum sp. CBA1109]|uniref:hypothetical protein n=1 Tax=Halapricum sp. CBA1109 TaxID=2668068 RepID=UPI0012F77769|nr:hypothetical protein [Halapricum sp. CBA1109]MUV89988.1 hypothetical protein [Halapricum sp. CBA1109]
MSEHGSVWDRLSEELTADLSVSVAAALAALPTLFAVAALTGRTDAPLYVAIDVAVFVPWVYDSHWPESYDASGARSGRCRPRWSPSDCSSVRTRCFRPW